MGFGFWQSPAGAVANTARRHIVVDGKLLHVCVSAKKGIAKLDVPSARITVEHGLEGDAHAGDWHRQVSLLAHVDIEAMRAKGLTLVPGAFGENLVIDGLQIEDLGVGSRLRIGPVLLELSQIGKVCHTRCAIYHSTGDCIMPRTGLFARVLESGEVAPGAAVQVVHRVARSVIQAAVVTISDRCSAGTAIDTAGPAVCDLLRDQLQAHIAWTKIVPDEMDTIADVLKDLCDRRVDLVITTGGTGISVRDVTPEATQSVIERELPGLAEAMRAVSAQKTPNALLSRGVTGVRGETLIVNVPGSLKGAVENLGAIMAAFPHAVKMLRGETAHVESDKGRFITVKGAVTPKFEPALSAEVR
jgi:molybdenum cofactor synthesis domain-containing protein